MKIRFLGVGEACDPAHPNTSILLETVAGGKKRQILLDCGFTVPHLYFAACDDPEQLDGLWISHFHGDHFFGVPLLLLRLWEMGRRRPLLLFGQRSTGEKIARALDLAYPGFGARLEYALEPVELEPDQPGEALDLEWRTAANEHSQRSLSLLIRNGRKSLFYSGDGKPTAATAALASGAGLVIHEAYHLEGDAAGHGSIRGCLEFARRAGAARLALVHLGWQTRRRETEIARLLAEAPDLEVFLPLAGDEIES